MTEQFHTILFYETTTRINHFGETTKDAKNRSNKFFNGKYFFFRWNGCSQQYPFDKMVVKWIDLFDETTSSVDFVMSFLLKNSIFRSNGHLAKKLVIGLLIVKHFFPGMLIQLQDNYKFGVTTHSVKRPLWLNDPISGTCLLAKFPFRYHGLN